MAPDRPSAIQRLLAAFRRSERTGCRVGTAPTEDLYLCPAHGIPIPSPVGLAADAPMKVLLPKVSHRPRSDSSAFRAPSSNACIGATSSGVSARRISSDSICGESLARRSRCVAGKHLCGHRPQPPERCQNPARPRGAYLAGPTREG
jgi:hypothetical protein